MKTKLIEATEAINQTRLLNANQKAILKELLSFEFSDKSKVIFASDNFFANKLGLSVRTVSRVINQFENMGLIQKDTIREPHRSRYDNSNRNTTTRYIYPKVSVIMKFVNGEVVDGTAQNQNVMLEILPVENPFNVKTATFEEIRVQIGKLLTNEYDSEILTEIINHLETNKLYTPRQIEQLEKDLGKFAQAS